MPNVPSERWTKACHESLSHQEPTVSSTSSPSPPPLNMCSHKSITMCWRVDFNFFRNERFSIGEKLKGMSLETLCMLDILIYRSPVREFYGTLTKGSGGFTCRVRATPVIVTFTLLGRILKWPMKGITTSFHSNREITLKLILGWDDINPLKVVSANQLSVEM